MIKKEFMPEMRTFEILPKAEIINSELFIDGEKFVLDANCMENISLSNDGGKIRVKFTVSQLIGSVDVGLDGA